MSGSYRVAIEAIAYNDEPTIRDPELMFGYASVLVVAAAFRKDQMKVAKDVIAYRVKHDLFRY